MIESKISYHLDIERIFEEKKWEFCLIHIYDANSHRYTQMANTAEYSQHKLHAKSRPASKLDLESKSNYIERKKCHS